MLERTGVTGPEAEQAAWTALPDGTRVGGARAIALALAVGRDASWPTLPWRVPGVPWMLDRVYGVVAANRTRIPGEEPWCQQHPDQCREP